MKYRKSWPARLATNKYRLIRFYYWRRYVYRAAMVFLIIFIIIFERNLFWKIEVKTIALLKEKRTLESYIIPLQLEDRFLLRPERVEKIAKKTFKMQKPSPDKVIEIIIK